MKKNSILTKAIVLILALLLFSYKSYSQNITIDTVKDYSSYSNYINLSKNVLTEIKGSGGELISQYEKTLTHKQYEDFKEYILWAHNLLEYNKSNITDVVLVNSNFTLTNKTFSEKELRISYSLGRSGCSDKDFFNKITISFHDISKSETKLDFNFTNCKSEEAVKKAIMDIPVPYK